MTARTDLDNAFSILDAGINAHVTALKSARDTAAAAQAVANDDSYLKELTSKVLSFADVLNGSNPAPLPPVVLTPEVAQAAQVAQVLPAFLIPPEVSITSAQPAPVAPEATLAPPSPSVLETMEAAVRAMVAKANP